MRWPIPHAARFLTCSARASNPPDTSRRRFRCRARPFPNICASCARRGWWWNIVADAIAFTTQSRAFEGGRFLARTLSPVLADESGEFEDFCGRASTPARRARPRGRTNKFRRNDYESAFEDHRCRLRLYCIAIACCAPALPSPESDAHKSFDLLKGMEGNWAGKNSQGQPLEVTFRMTAGGSAAHERNSRPWPGEHDHHVPHGWRSPDHDSLLRRR